VQFHCSVLAFTKESLGVEVGSEVIRDFVSSTVFDSCTQGATTIVASNVETVHLKKLNTSLELKTSLELSSSLELRVHIFVTCELAVISQFSSTEDPNP